MVDIPDVAFLMVGYNPDMEIGTSFFIGSRPAIRPARRSSTGWILRPGVSRPIEFAPASAELLVRG